MTEDRPPDDRGRESLVAALLGDGRPLLATVAVSLLFAGAFATFLAARGEFLPHDIGYLGQTAEELRALGEGRVVDFMLHDRVAYGGALLAIGLLYLWLIAVPLAHDRAGFGGAILTGGLLATGAVLHAAGSRALWQAVAGAGALAFGPAIVVHHAVGYTDPWHLAPAYAAAAVIATGLVLTRP